jgi:hypothetical protein
MSKANEVDPDSSSDEERSEGETQLSPRVPDELAEAYRSFIKLEEGKYRTHQSEYIEQGLRLQLGLWIVGHSYQLHHVYDVDWIDNPDEFVAVALDCVQEVKEIVDEIHPQLAALQELDVDEVNKQTISTLPGRAAEDDSTGKQENAIQLSDDVVAQLTEVVEQSVTKTIGGTEAKRGESDISESSSNHRDEDGGVKPSQQ